MLFFDGYSDEEKSFWQYVKSCNKHGSLDNCRELEYYLGIEKYRQMYEACEAINVQEAYFNFIRKLKVENSVLFFSSIAWFHSQECGGGTSDSDLSVIFKLLYGDCIIKTKNDYYVYLENKWYRGQSYFVQALTRVFKTYTYYLENTVDSEKIINEYKRRIGSIKSVRNIIDYFINCDLSESDIIFDTCESQYYELHFKNGVLNLETKEFRKRNMNDYVTMWLDYDYTLDYSQENYNEIDDFFTKLQPDPVQKNFTVSFLKYCLAGGNRKQTLKMNIGFSASNGKTSEITIHSMCFPLYTYKLDTNCLKVNCSKRHKYLSAFINQPIRLTILNELPSDKLDAEFICDIVDNTEMSLEKLFTTDDAKFKPQTKIMTTSNLEPNFDNHSGVKRRVVFQHYNSQFVDADKVDIEKHRYPKIADYYQRFDKHEYKIAYLHYLLNAPDLVIPKENKELAQESIEENDDYLDVFNNHFIVTGDHNDKLQKDQVIDVFRSQGIFKNIQELNRNLKKYGVVYDKNSQINNQRKVYRRLRLTENNDELEVPE